MNQTIIIGNLTKDPESRTTSSGKTVCNFTVAVNKGTGDKKVTTYFRVAAWDKTGAVCQQYLAKGRRVAVIGEIGVSAYINNAGQAVGNLELMSNSVEFQPSSAEGRGQTENTSAAPTGFTPVENPEDLPF